MTQVNCGFVGCGLYLGIHMRAVFTDCLHTWCRLCVGLFGMLRHVAIEPALLVVYTSLYCHHGECTGGITWNGRNQHKEKLHRKRTSK